MAEIFCYSLLCLSYLLKWIKSSLEEFFIRCHAFVKLGDNTAVEEEKSRFLENHQNDALRLESLAQVEYVQGRQDAALGLLLQAFSHAQGAQRKHLALRVATHYLIRRQYSHAIPYYEELKEQLDRDSLLARDYLIALYNSRSYSKAHQLARSLRANGSKDPYVLEILSQLAEWTGDLRSASELYAELATIQQNPSHYLLAQARVEFRQANFDHARTILIGLKPKLPDDPRDLIQIAQMLVILDVHVDVIEMAYRARRMGMNDPNIHLAFMQIFLAVEQKSPARFQVAQVGEDTAVYVNELHGEKRWLKIYASMDPFVLTWCETTSPYNLL